MAGVITPSDLTFNGKEVMSLSEAIMETAFENPQLTDLHTIATGIKGKQQIAFLGLLGLVGKTSTGCAPDENPGTIPMTEKFWDPKYIEDRFAQCWKDLLPSFFQWGLKNGVKKADLSGTDFLNFLEDRISIAMKEAVLRLAWFADTAAANYNSSPAGVIKNGINVAYFNPFNGLWKQIFTIAAAHTTQKVAIAKNAGATYPLQAFDSTDTTNQVVTNILQTMLDTADTRLSEQESPEFIVTKSVADQYMRERRNFPNIDIAYTRTEDGWDTLKISGVTIKVFPFWDRMIKSYYDNGTKLYLPHRIVLTTKDNIPVGTEEESTLAELNPFYDEKSKTFYVDFGFNMDAKLLEDYKLMTAY